MPPREVAATTSQMSMVTHLQSSCAARQCHILVNCLMSPHLTETMSKHTANMCVTFKNRTTHMARQTPMDNYFPHKAHESAAELPSGSRQTTDAKNCHKTLRCCKNRVQMRLRKPTLCVQLRNFMQQMVHVVCLPSLVWPVAQRSTLHSLLA